MRRRGSDRRRDERRRGDFKVTSAMRAYLASFDNWMKEHQPESGPADDLKASSYRWMVGESPSRRKRKTRRVRRRRNP